jgi:hypothetical protein
MSNPPSRIPPRNQPQETKAGREEIHDKKKVEKVREVDADETRKRKFQKFLGDEAPAKEEPLPTLFDLSSPPKKTASLKKEQDLPQSKNFYDMENDEKAPEMKEEHLPQIQDPGKKVEVKGFYEPKSATPTPPGKKEVKKEEELPIRQGRDHGVKNVSAKKADKVNEEEEIVSALSIPVADKKEHFFEKEGEKKITEITRAFDYPPSIQSNIASVTQQVSSYLHPTTTALFAQMVGQIYLMTDQGIQRTEIILNNPAFANSIFYGSSITIEKYATAPDSFNIRLSGTEQAVKSFKQNAASLMSAFENGKFAFRINRLDAEFSIERPVFRRRERGDKDKGEKKR